jgi:Protein of unknown function (DUF1553)/Protein of unknown function (DUF1549)
MLGRVPSRPIGFLAFVFALSASSFAAGPEGARVTLWEAIPKDWSWSAPRAAPSDSFERPALAFTRLPVKYNARGIEVDRAGPFALHAAAGLHEPEGSYRLIFRGRNEGRVLIDGQVIAKLKPINPNSAGHEDVPDAPIPEDPRWRPAATGDQEAIVAWESDGKLHTIEVWALLGDRKLRPETGELAVSVVAKGGVPRVIGAGKRIELTDEGWSSFMADESQALAAFDSTRRRDAAHSEDAYWAMRHEEARREALRNAPPDPPGTGNLIDRYASEALAAKGETIGPAIDDASFFRRLSLDTTGMIPEPGEARAFLDDQSADKRARAVIAKLADPRWADSWMGYWQDVLAENPGILKPTLNNTGPFRKYLYTAFLDDKPADRFATELIRMEGSALGGGPAGFAIASQNDAPMAAKAQVVAKAFLAAEMKCARCHDSPSHPFDQSDLFGIGGLLAGKPLKVPVTSTVKSQEGGRAPAVSVTLVAGESVAPHWNLPEVRDDSVPESLLPPNADSRDRLAVLITAPSNKRFAPVMVNRIWKRYMGVGLVEPVDDWDVSPKTSNAALLDALARELIVHDYDLKHVARLILTSNAYQARARGVANLESADAAIPARRRMSAEQLLDSMFAAAGKPFRAEELNLDADGRRPPTEFLNLGVPTRAWQFTSTSNERDRPALSLPMTQSLVDVLETFGWRPARQDAISVRDEATTPLQPALLANGVVATGRVARLSDDSAFTALCLRDQSAERLIEDLYLRILSRTPTTAETDRVAAYLGDTYSGRVVPGAKAHARPLLTPARRVSWSNHLSPAATQIQRAAESSVRQGDPPTERLTPAFRERMEDIVWALINSPEFVFVP